MLALTDSAVDAVRQVLVEAEEDLGLRIAVQAGGCSGFRYQLELVPAAEDGDEILEVSGLKIFIDSESVTLLDGAEVDYVDDVGGSGFIFNNPNAKSGCSCGKSFC